VKEALMKVRLSLAVAALGLTFVTGCQNRMMGGGDRHAHAGHHGYHEHPFSQMPAPVQEAVRRDYPNAEVVSSGHEWLDRDGSAHYHVKVRTPNGGTNTAEYDAMGKRLAD
jgi:hypothetical protein